MPDTSAEIRKFCGNQDYLSHTTVDSFRATLDGPKQAKALSSLLRQNFIENECPTCRAPRILQMECFRQTQAP